MTTTVVVVVMMTMMIKMMMMMMMMMTAAAMMIVRWWRSGTWLLGGGMLRPPRAAEPKGTNNKYFNLTKFDYLLSKNCKVLSQIKGHSVNKCDFFFNFAVSVKGGPGRQITQLRCW